MQKPLFFGTKALNISFLKNKGNYLKRNSSLYETGFLETSAEDTRHQIGIRMNKYVYEVCDYYILSNLKESNIFSRTLKYLEGHILLLKYKEPSFSMYVWRESIILYYWFS